MNKKIKIVVWLALLLPLTFVAASTLKCDVPTAPPVPQALQYSCAESNDCKFIKEQGACLSVYPEKFDPSANDVVTVCTSLADSVLQLACAFGIESGDKQGVIALCFCEKD